MVTFIASIAALVGGYLLYGRFIARFFGEDPTRKTPAYALKDGVDFIPLPRWKVFLIQFLNIAGLGPIFGAILGAMYGPWAYVWIVVGCIFMGGVHDYFSGMLSVRNSGASLPELVGKYLGVSMQQVLRVFTVLLLIFVGVAFVTGPAGLLSKLTHGGTTVWLYVIFAYYLVATLLPINKIIGKIYPVFGIALLVMAVGIGVVLFWQGATGAMQLMELTPANLKNWHHTPSENILLPMMFIVISCGAISGFHSTQAPMMARCLKNEKQGRHVFYGAMVAEGIVAIIWATAAMNFFGDAEALNVQMAAMNYNPAEVVDRISRSWLGNVGAVFAIIGVIALPISTGDTAFRSARLTVADMLSFKQQSISSRLIISIPLFIVGFVLSQLDFATVWKYLGLSNQVLATVVLWMGAAYLAKNRQTHWYLTIPAMFMTFIVVAYIFVAPHKNGGLALNPTFAYAMGVAVSLAITVYFLLRGNYWGTKSNK
ncbi:MAG: carbon starvation CstA family protein [Salinivirgaceae bacterium]